MTGKRKQSLRDHSLSCALNEKKGEYFYPLGSALCHPVCRRLPRRCLGAGISPVALEEAGGRDVGNMPWGSWGEGCSAEHGGLHSREKQTQGREQTRSLTVVYWLILSWEWDTGMHLQVMLCK